MCGIIGYVGDKACDRILLARVMFGGLERIATRMQRNLDAAFRLFDPEGGLGLELLDTPRDAKRAINALGAALPMLPAHVDVADAALEIVLRVLVPEIDGQRLETRARTRDRNALYAELVHKLGGHRRLAATNTARYDATFFEPPIETARPLPQTQVSELRILAGRPE